MAELAGKDGISLKVFNTVKHKPGIRVELKSEYLPMPGGLVRAGEAAWAQIRRLPHRDRTFKRQYLQWMNQKPPYSKQRVCLSQTCF